MASPRPDSVRAFLEAELTSLRSQSQFRHLAVTQGLDLCSNDYLGLSSDPRLRRAVVAALDAGSSVGSTGSRLLSGNSAAWEQLERELAQFEGAETALFFNSGYAANLGLLASILQPGDVVFSDASNHASIIDGIRLSRARKVIFPHLDLNFLEDKLREHAAAPIRKIVVTETLFSMEGDRAPVSDLLDLARRYGAELIFDEAHATGVFGPGGRGLVAAAGAQGRALATMHTCGKALASVGAFVCGSETLKQFLVNRARTFIFSTALPPYLAAQIAAAVGIVAAADEERARLAALSARLRARLRQAGFDTGSSDSQIVPVLLGENERALRFAEGLARAGFAVRAIRPPTVPPGTARLRFSLHAGLSDAVLDRLVDSMVRIREELAPVTCGARP